MPEPLLVSDSPSSSSGENRDLEALILRAGDGDQQAIGRIMEHYRSYLRAIAARRMPLPLRRRMDASDIVQQTLMDAQQQMEQLLTGGDEELRGALRHILRCNIANAIRDHFVTEKRRLGREYSHDEAVQNQQDQRTSPSLQFAHRELLERFLELLDELPADQSQAVHLRYCEGLSVSEIAEYLGRSRAATAGLLKRGLRALREKFAGESGKWM